ncbi:MAG: M48 family metalloprotease [Acidobacteria bacterium]|nr:M48 family metalloprotease [Acidobacteriota bacterium]
MKTRNRTLLLVLLFVTAPALLAFELERTRISPGWNLFSTEQDVEIGREVSKEAESKLRLVRNSDVDSYANVLGKSLARMAPGARYPYQVKVVDDKTINAFALPGGHLYLNRGIFDHAGNEAQLAGVLAHEIAHVALRHGTNQMSKAYAAQAPLALLGGLIGSDSLGGILAQVGASFAANSVLLKFSRDAERQADILGTQILYDNNYDPRAMAQFFQKLESSGGSRGMEFFSSHPNPGNRIGIVNQEINNLGGTQRNYRSDSAEFQRIKRLLRSRYG